MATNNNDGKMSDNVNPTFDQLTIDQNQVSEVLQRFLNYSSKRLRVSATDLIILEPTPVKDDKQYTYVQLVKAGNKLIDIMYFLAIGNKKNFQFTKWDYDGEPPVIKETDTAEAVFVLWFYLMSRGAAPTEEDEKKGVPTPRFVTEVMHLKKKPYEYMKILASFDLNQMDATWIKGINLNKLGDETRQRMGLGVAGHRYLDVFKQFLPSKILTDIDQKSYDVLKQVSANGPYWTLHSSFKEPTLIRKFNSLNQVLLRLIMRIYDDDLIATLKKNKIIPAEMIADERYNKVIEVTARDFDMLHENIFGVKFEWDFEHSVMKRL